MGQKKLAITLRSVAFWPKPSIKFRQCKVTATCCESCLREDSIIQLSRCLLKTVPSRWAPAQFWAFSVCFFTPLNSFETRPSSMSMNEGWKLWRNSCLKIKWHKRGRILLPLNKVMSDCIYFNWYMVVCVCC